MNRTKATYVLILALDKESAITVGKLGAFSFPSGYYLYAGSALGGLSQRLMRHLQMNKRPHWHIDYLRQNCKVVEVWYLLSEERLECTCYQAAAGLPLAQSMVAGFGSSDCRCRSHLVYSPTRPSLETFKRLLKRPISIFLLSDTSYPIESVQALSYTS